MAKLDGAQARADIGRILSRENDFLVAAHYNPDGDALGSTAAMGWLLHALGKRFVLYNASPAPRQFDWLHLPARLENELPARRPGWYIILDSGDERRVGQDLAQAFDRSRTVVIDHHLDNPMFGAVNWVDTSLSSVGEMIGLLARDLSIPLAGPLAEALYLAMVTDTGHFSYSNTRPQTMEMAAELLRGGLDPAAVNEKISSQWSPEKIRLWSRVLGGLKTYFQDRLGVIRISQADFEATGASPEDTDGLINTVRSIRGMVVAASLREDGPEEIKISLRSSGTTDVQAVAASFGGGGHRNAAGGTIRGNMDQAEQQLVQAIGAMREMS